MGRISLIILQIVLLLVISLSFPLYAIQNGSKLDIASLSEIDETDRIPYQSGWPVVYPHQSLYMSESIVPVNVDHSDFQLEIGLLDANDVNMWNHDGTRLDGWGFDGHVPRGFAIISKVGDTRVAMTNKNEDLNYLYDYRARVYEGWPVYSQHGMDRSPMIVDLEGDGVAEIVGSAGTGTMVHAWNQDGSDQDGWPVEITGPANGFAAGDVDNDGVMDVVFTSLNIIIKRAWIINCDGEIISSWRVICNDTEVCSQSPILVDLDGDHDLEIIVATKSQIIAYEHTGTIVWQYFLDYPDDTSQLAAGDLDGDEIPEIVFAIDDKLYVLNTAGLLFSGYWPKELIRGSFLNTACIHSGVAIADIDDDTEQEIIIEIELDFEAFLIAFNSDASLARGFPIRQNAMIDMLGTPAVADIDLDGDVEICTYGRGAIQGSNSSTHVFIYDLPSAYNPEYCDWPMIHQNPQRTCCLPLPTADDIFAGTGGSLYLTAKDFNLSAFPNPFNPQTTISFTLPEDGNVNLTIYNTAGQQVAVLMDGRHPAGYHQAVWDARAMPSGVYFYRLTTGGYSEIKKCVLVK